MNNLELDGVKEGDEGNYIVSIEPTGCKPFKIPFKIQLKSKYQSDILLNEITINENALPIEIPVSQTGGKLIGPGVEGLTFNANIAGIGRHELSYTITDNGCTSVDNVVISVRGLIKVMEFVSPNGDNFNDYFTIKNIDKYVQSELMVLDRWGKEVFKKTSYRNDWDCSSLEEGTYHYILKVDDKEYKGSFMLKK